MSGASPIGASTGSSWEALSCTVRAACDADVPAVVAGVGELLVELGGKPAATSALEEAARALISDPAAGALLVAENQRDIVGVLGVSWQLAIRIPGRYGLIQELWVHSAWRADESRRGPVGGALGARTPPAGLPPGGWLPSERFKHLGATEAFYMNNGFTTIGMRMRRVL